MGNVHEIHGEWFKLNATLVRVQSYAAAARRSDGVRLTPALAQTAQAKIVEQAPAAAGVLPSRVPRDDLLLVVVHGRLEKQIVLGHLNGGQ